jgi:fructose-1,6-bisphosphatase/inositol monophosphatase family enzyme
VSSDLSEINLVSILSALEELVSESNQLIVNLLKRGAYVSHKDSGLPGELVTEIDEAVDLHLNESLLKLIPGSGWQSEESDSSPSTVAGSPTWVVDPIDGTSNLVHNPSAGEYGTSIALFVNQELSLGVIGLPLGFSRNPEDSAVITGVISLDELPVRVNGEPLTSGDTNPVGVVISWHDRWVRQVIPEETPVYAVGSVVMRLALVATGQSEMYVSTGLAQGFRSHYALHDVAGGAAIVRAANKDLYDSDCEPVELKLEHRNVRPFVAGSEHQATQFIKNVLVG